MTPEELKESPLKRGDFLRHTAMGFVSYAAKVRNDPSQIVVIYSHIKGAKEIRVKVKVADCTRHKRAAKKKQTYMILCVCSHCELKIRTTRQWLETGEPRCFNNACPASYHSSDGSFVGAELTVELGVDGGAVVGQDMKEVGRDLQRNYHGRDVQTPPDEESES